MIVRKTGIIVYNSNKQVIRQSDNSKDFFKKFIVEVFTKTSKYVQLYRKTNLCMQWGCINISLKHWSIGNFFLKCDKNSIVTILHIKNMARFKWHIFFFYLLKDRYKDYDGFGAVYLVLSSKRKDRFQQFVARITPYHWRLLAAIWFYNKQT